MNNLIKLPTRTSIIIALIVTFLYFISYAFAAYAFIMGSDLFGMLAGLLIGAACLFASRVLVLDLITNILFLVLIKISDSQNVDIEKLAKDKEPLFIQFTEDSEPMRYDWK